MNGAVTASTQAAADAGARILGQGGNAADAAVAAALATCVADPCNTGLGGYGGYLLLHRRDQPAAHCVQFPLWAPSGMAAETLARSYPEQGPECSCVPNVVGGLARALREFGRLSWAQVSIPAIALARHGVAASATVRRAFALHRDRAFVGECFELEESREAGLVFRQPALATTLERMAEEGPDWFYAGPLGLGAHGAWQAAGVEIALEDWRAQHETVDVVEAPSLEVDGVRMHAAPLGLTGSACVFATFAAAARIGRHERLSGARALAELAAAMAAVWQYRFAMPNGNDFSGVEIARWVEEALERRGAGAAAAAEPAHTTHLNAVDREGMLAALTFTHGPAWFGGRWAIPGSGVIMNGGMHNFSRPGAVRRAGRWLGVSNMTPTIAADSAGNRVALGSPGARRIPSNIALVLGRHFVAAEPLQAAVSAGRFHAEEPDRVFVEESRLAAEVKAELGKRFAAVEPQAPDDYFGPLTAIRIGASGHVETAVDDRDSAGYAAGA